MGSVILPPLLLSLFGRDRGSRPGPHVGAAVTVLERPRAAVVLNAAMPRPVALRVVVAPALRRDSGLGPAAQALPVLVDLAREPHHRDVKPRRRQGDGQLVSDTQPRERPVQRLRVEARVQQAEVVPTAPEQTAHDTSGPLRMPLALGAVHVRLAEVPEVVDGECDPQTRVTREAVEPPPRRSDEPRVQRELVSAEQDASGPDVHSPLPPGADAASSPSYTDPRGLVRGPGLEPGRCEPAGLTGLRLPVSPPAVVTSALLLAPLPAPLRFCLARLELARLRAVLRQPQLNEPIAQAAVGGCR